MHLADHIRPLLRDHDCVIIPGFGGLVADVSPARARPGRQALSPPTKLVAFNQALTRNDGLLVDALSQHLGLPIAQAREAVRTAVAGLQRELDETNRTELPGIGIFRRAVGRGLAFEYTGTDNLLAAAFGLPELAARPVRANDARPRRPQPQPALRGIATRRSRLARLLPGGIIAVAAGLLLLANYQFLFTAGYLPANWLARLPRVEPRSAEAASVPAFQQAARSQHGFGSGVPVEVETAAPEAATEPADGQPEAAAARREPEAPELPAVPAAAAGKKVAGKKLESAAPAVTVASAPAAAAAAQPTTIKSRTGRYYVIAGAYSTLAHAERGHKALTRTGHASRIILPPAGSRLFRLTAADYPDLASAQREAQRLRVRTRGDYNTLKF
ncbi:SPOR domain-containing protein [Hymenobacter sp.]|uniref:HU domain-containing protein n=1 Tax=Hymenobacter sp. TaxID=1898978 RepID=UPI00286C52BA|nr:SPOR domain-containing protein [Hymenobacter sp.]